MIVGSRPAREMAPADEPASPPPARARVFLPPPEVLRQLLPRPMAPVAPKPAPTPVPAVQPRERISIGPPVQARQEGPLMLRREDDLTRVAKGRPDATPGTPTPPPPDLTPEARVTTGDGRMGAGRGADAGLRLPPGTGELARGREGAGSGREAGGERSAAPSIAASLRDLDRRLQARGDLGLPTGTDRQMGALLYDDQGADFTAWFSHFKNDVHRNWIVPQAAMLGFAGAVEIEFTVERDGRISSLRVLKGSGTASLDRAAENALRGSRFLPLPADFGPARFSVRVVFHYNVAPPRAS